MIWANNNGIKYENKNKEIDFLNKGKTFSY